MNREGSEQLTEVRDLLDCLKEFNSLGLLLDHVFQCCHFPVQPEKEVEALSQKSIKEQIPKEQ